MKLKRLQINSKFRSLQPGFEIKFNEISNDSSIGNFAPYCLVGRNGSGKSNILEALASIFYHLECIYLDFRPDYFDYDEENNPGGFTGIISYPDEFELEYILPATWGTANVKWKDAGKSSWKNLKTYVRIIKTTGNPPVIQTHNGEGFPKDTQKSTIDRLQGKEILPKYILAYSSGENEILSLPFFKIRFIQFEEYKYKADRGAFDKPEVRMIYADKDYSQAILISNILMQDSKVLKPFLDVIKLKEIATIRLIIQQNKFLKVDAEQEKMINDAHSEFTLKNKEEGKPIRELSEADFKKELTACLDQSGGIIDKLKKCATVWFTDDDDVLYLDYKVESSTKAAFQFHFDNEPIELFRAFQVLLTLNLYVVDLETKIELYNSESRYVNETVPTPASHERISRFKDVELIKKNVSSVLYLKDLSDGEHQFIHSIGICLLARNNSSLILLDEPETHFNPDWRSKFISTLNKCFYRSQEEKSNKDQEIPSHEILITSHSPFIVSDCPKENVYIFKKNEKTQKVTWDKPKQQTFGASVNFLTKDIFEKENTISEMAYDAISKIAAKIAKSNKDKLANIRNEIYSTFGNSVEKMFLLDLLDQKNSSRKKGLKKVTLKTSKKVDLAKKTKSIKKKK